jgi:hypothetical protein
MTQVKRNTVASSMSTSSLPRMPSGKRESNGSSWYPAKSRELSGFILAA